MYVRICYVLVVRIVWVPWFLPLRSMNVQRSNFKLEQRYTFLECCCRTVLPLWIAHCWLRGGGKALKKNETLHLFIKGMRKGKGVFLFLSSSILLRISSPTSTCTAWELSQLYLALVFGLLRSTSMCLLSYRGDTCTHIFSVDKRKACKL